MTSSFACRVTRQPLPFDPIAGAGIAADFAELDAVDLLAATAACSPYLRDLMRREADWLRVALTLAPETAFAAVMASLTDFGPDLASALRQAKRRIALLVALADLGGVWRLAEVTQALTTFADRAVQACVTHLVADEVRRGKLPDAINNAGYVVLAMGKMGAGELNYSSDIDLICLFDDAQHRGREQDARTALIRVTRRMAALLSDVTDGYVFRVDLRLRPDASVTPVCLSMAAAEAYYEAEGRTWERAAYIKARPCAGDLAAGARFLAALTPFVWRKHLDFAAIQDAHDMRRRIRDHRGLQGRIGAEGHDLKLGLGGIREIEFFTQTRQLIAGGRDASLRPRGTVAGLQALAAKGWLPGEVAEELAGHYAALRELEHRLQMVGDAQTHQMPITAEGVARIAAFSGTTEAEFRAGLLGRLRRVAHLTEGFFAPTPVAADPDPSPQTKAIVARWPHYPALRSDRAQAIFQRLRPAMLARLSRAANPEEALVALDGFLAGLPSGVQIFALFEANPALVDLIIDIAATAPALAAYLSRNAGVLDAVIGGTFFAPWPGAALRDDLTLRLAVGDYERALDAARVWMREWHFRIGVHHLRGLIDAFEAGRQYADLAEAVVAGLWPVVLKDFSVRHGPPPGRGAVVVGMGSLGAGRLNAGSDLDLIVIYDAAGVEVSVGRKPLAARAYYARLTQAFVTALTVPMAAGRLYEVDMRLRPSGRQGPVATSFAGFCSYQRDEAWTWEHLALTRARVLAGQEDLAAEVEAFRRALLVEKGTGSRVRADVAAMRARLAGAKPGLGEWEAKLGAGRLMDVELVAELLALQAGSGVRGVEAQIEAGVLAGLVSDLGATGLLAAYRVCWQVQAGLRLLSGKRGLGEGGRAFLLRETGMAGVDGLFGAMAARCAVAAGVIEGLVG